jgi:neutral trehalase
MDAEYLALIADAIGQPADAARFRAEHQAMNTRINDTLWNEEAGMYCNRLWDHDGQPGKFLTRYSPMNFYPMLCGAPDADRGKRILAVLTDPQKFWGQWIVPTLAYDDPGWSRQQYWHGKVWGPVNYLIFQGLKRYASPQIQAELADKSITIFMQNWTTRGVCGENFLSTTGQQSSESHYTWGALMCLIGLESVVDQTPDGQIIIGQRVPTGLDLRHIPMNGKRYKVSVQNGRAQFVEEH